MYFQLRPVSTRASIASVIATLCWMTSAAAAQDPLTVAPLPKRLVTLQLQLPQPGSTVEVESMNAPRRVERRVVLRCERDCAAMLSPGRYQLTLHRPDSTDDDTQTVRLSRPMSYRALEPNRELRWLGVTSFVVGGLLMVTGAAALLEAVVIRTVCEGVRCSGAPGFGRYALIASPTGVVLAVVGVILFLNNRRAFARSPIVARSNVHFGMSASSSGVGGLLSLAF